jgi:hypothetical protein
MTLRDDMLADLDNVFFNQEDFAESASYRLRAGTVFPVTVIFDAVYSEAELQEAYVQGRAVAATMAEASLPAGHGKGDSITIRTRLYSIITMQPDGAGVVVLTLHKG